eukprot:m.32221 g.32221  ORF g.32221 m.32221 type:complete len:375 (+) comp10764_c1_seq1:174-1298(+)
MDERSAIAASPEYHSFRSTVPKRTVDVHYRGKEYTWKLFDYGPKDSVCPLVFFPPVSGTADVFFRQIISLTAEGFRCIAADYPIVWDVEEFVGVTRAFFEQFNITKVHVVGASLGAFLAQKLAEITKDVQLVQSLTLINGFTDTSAFKSAPPAFMVQIMPGFMLKRMLMMNFPSDNVTVEVADSIDFLVEQLDLLTQPELASRLTLNIKPAYVDPHPILDQEIPIMIVEVTDKCAVTTSVKLELLKYYPHARVAHIKNGGNFPYIAASTDVDMFIKVHLRPFYGTDKSPTNDPELNERFRSSSTQLQGQEDVAPPSLTTTFQPSQTQQRAPKPLPPRKPNKSRESRATQQPLPEKPAKPAKTVAVAQEEDEETF